MIDKIRWGIIGPGKIAENFANDLKLVDDAVLTGVASRDPERARQFSQKFDITHFFEDYDALFNSNLVDALYIATPHTFHKELAIRAMQAGKHVLCEKPMGINSKEVAEMIAVAKQNKVFFMEALWTRFNPTILAVKQLVDNGTLGDLGYVNADFAFYAMDKPLTSRLFDLNLGGGTILDIGIYPVFLAYLFLGMPRAIKSVSDFNPTGTEIQTSVIFQYDNAHAVLNSSFRYNSRMSAEIAGTKAAVTLLPRFHETQGYDLYINDEVTRVNLPTIGKGYSYEIMEVNRCLKSGTLESSLWSHQNSTDLMLLLDKVREIGGVKFPSET